MISEEKTEINDRRCKKIWKGRKSVIRAFSPYLFRVVCFLSPYSLKLSFARYCSIDNVISYEKGLQKVRWDNSPRESGLTVYSIHTSCEGAAIKKHLGYG